MDYDGRNIEIRVEGFSTLGLSRTMSLEILSAMTFRELYDSIINTEHAEGKDTLAAALIARQYHDSDGNFCVAYYSMSSWPAYTNYVQKDSLVGDLFRAYPIGGNRMNLYVSGAYTDIYLIDHLSDTN